MIDTILTLEEIMATFNELMAQGVTRMRRPMWNAGTYLEVAGNWATLIDPAGYAALEQTEPYRFVRFMVPWHEDDFEPVPESASGR